MKWIAVLCALCAGCDLLFDLHGFAATSDGGLALDADGSNHSPCSTIAMLADDFDDGDLDVLWSSRVDPGNALTEEAGTAQLQLPGPDSYVSLVSKAYFDLREGDFTIDLQAPDFAMTDTLALTLRSENHGFSVQWYRHFSEVSTDTMSLTVIADGVTMPARDFTFDPIADRYLRTRLVGDEVYFETSPDDAAGSYVTQDRAAASGLTFVQVELQAFHGTNVTNAPLTVFVDHVDGGTPRGAACPVASLHDTFDTDALLPRWARTTMTGGTIDGITSQLVMRTNAAPPGTVEDDLLVLEPSAFYDLQDSSVSIDIEKMVTLTEGPGETRRVALTVTTATGDQIELAQHGGMLEGIATPRGAAAVTAFARAWDPVAMRWWRIEVKQSLAGPPGTMIASWLTSADGKSWTAHGSTPKLAGFDRSDLMLQTHVAAMTSETARFDNFNVAPP